MRLLSNLAVTILAAGAVALVFAQGPATVAAIVYPGASMTSPHGMNNLNQITGDFNPGTGVTYGFMRSSAGIYSQFACPNGADTHPAAINNFGMIVGTCGVPVISQGFIRDASGNFTMINYPGASYTTVAGVNDSGQVTGYYGLPSGSTFILHGFIRDLAGHIDSFDVPGASTTVPVGINNAGQITGYYGSTFASVFLRSPDGSMLTLLAPGIPTLIDNGGRVIGTSTAETPVWVRDVNGSITPLVVTLPHRNVLAAINDSGAITGQDWDTAAGFLSVPCASASLNPISRTHGPGNEIGQVTVTAPLGCSWSTASYSDWIIHPSGVLSGPQETTTTYVVLPNDSGLTRIGSLNIAGQIFTVTQPAGQCGYSLTGPHDLPPTGGTGAIAISTATGCGWTALPVQLQSYGGGWDPIPWLSVSPESGFGNGTASFSADKCSGCSATVLIGNTGFDLRTPAFSSQIYVQDDASRSVTAWFMNGAAQAGTAVLSGSVPGWHLAATTDFNRDGVPDLIWQNDTSGLATVWFMGGAGDSELLSWAWLGDGSVDWRVVAAYDFDRSGIPDLVWQNQITGEATIWYMTMANGVPQIVQWTYLSGPQVGWRIAAVATLPAASESNSALALLWQNSTSGDVTIWLMNSNSTPSNSGLYRWRYVTSAIGPDWRAAGMSSSGTEIYWQNEISREMTVWHMPYLVVSNVLTGWDYLVPSATPGAHLIAR